MNYHPKTKEELAKELLKLQKENDTLRALCDKGISELRQAEEAQKMSRIGNWEWDILANKTEWSDTLYDIFGVTAEHFDPDASETFINCIHPDDRQNVKLIMEQCLATKEAFEINYRIIRPDGEEKFIHARGQLVTDSNGRPVRMMGTSQDITERKITEESIRESENLYRKMIINSPLGMHFYTLSSDNQLYFEGANPAADQILNVDHTQFIGKTIVEAFPSLINTEVPDRYRDAADKGILWSTEQIAYNDGKISGAFEVRAFQTMPGKMVAIFSDITNRKKVEFELVEAKETAEVNSANITAIIEGTTNSIWAFNRNFEILYINKIFQVEFFQTFGVHLVPGINLIDSLPAALQPFWKPRYDRVLNKEQFTVEDAINTNNGIIYIQVTFNPIVKNGQVIGGSCIGSNITPRKLAEIELLKAKAKAEESDRLKSSFLANMSHEIRTPMNGIMGFAELLQSPKLSGEEIKEYVNIIRKSGDRMLNIINDLIDISKIESGQMDVIISSFNLNEQTNYIFNFFKPEAEKKHLKFSFVNTLPDNKAVIISDKEKIIAILINLVKNALKFTDDGSIEFGYANKESTIEFYIKDTGIGISPHQKEIIFERFRQGNESSGRNYEGAGLGLFISKSYVEMLGGNIWVEDNIDSNKKVNGSIMYFTIPYNHDPVQKIKIAKAVSENTTEINVKDLKILIAEDDEVSVIILMKLMRMFCKEVITVRTGVEAIETCRHNRDIDLVFMDIKMPQTDGYEATRQIRSFNKDIVIIAQTAFALTHDKEKALEAGCNDYISKPIKKDDLYGLIKKHINKKR